jgi:ketosteroid isomerase-like protein
MSQETAQVVREQFQAILNASNARDFDALAELLPGEVEFGSVLAAAEGAEAYTGVDGLRKWAEQVDAIWEDWHQEVVEFRQVSDTQAVAITRATGRARTSGVPLDTLTGNVLTWGDGKGWRIRAYLDPREALEAVGLPE